MLYCYWRKSNPFFVRCHSANGVKSLNGIKSNEQIGARKSEKWNNFIKTGEKTAFEAIVLMEENEIMQIPPVSYRYILEQIGLLQSLLQIQMRHRFRLFQYIIHAVQFPHLVSFGTLSQFQGFHLSRFVDNCAGSGFCRIATTNRSSQMIWNGWLHFVSSWVFFWILKSPVCFKFQIKIVNLNYRSNDRSNNNLFHWWYGCYPYGFNRNLIRGELYPIQSSPETKSYDSHEDLVAQDIPFHIVHPYPV